MGNSYSDEEQAIHDRAIEFARHNKDRIARAATSTEKYAADSQPISVFMAGSPGAGKTEFSKNLITLLEKDKIRQVVRIDADEFRREFKEYNGNNSSLFHGAVSLIVEKVHDFVLHNSQSFILDGMLSHYQKAMVNIQRSLDKNRAIIIFYIFQLPEVAWKFTQDREKLEGRNITKEMFIEGFLGAIDTIRQILVNYSHTQVSIFMVKKDYIRNEVKDIALLNTGEHNIDSLLPKRYIKEDLEKML